MGETIVKIRFEQINVRATCFGVERNKTSIKLQ